jgi:glycine hydroxymethyltransferase
MLSPAASAFAQRHQSAFEGQSLDTLDAELHRLVAVHEQSMDHESIVLYAGTNMSNPRARNLLASSLTSRPNLGHPGDTYNRGMDNASAIEVMCTELLKKLFNAKFVEHRVASGSIANLYAFMATCEPGDDIIAFSDAAAGHVTHHRAGAAGLYRLTTHNAAFDTNRMDVDVAALRAQAHQVKPKLIIVAGSMCLHPYSVQDVRTIADEVGAYVLYDAAHMGGLIAGGAFQQPLAEGAHLMTGSTYKSFGGPASGMILTNDAELASRLDAIAYPGLTANFDLGKTAAMCIAAMDQLEFGAAYAAACIANAQALAQALHEQGVDVFAAPERGFTSSQHVALRAHNYGGGNAAAKTLEPANILLSSIGLPGPEMAGEANGIRIGTQEVTRWGMGIAEMTDIASLVARVLVHQESPATVRSDVVQFRQRFQQLHFVRH